MREDALVVEKFKDVLVAHLKEVSMALPAIVPQTNEDKIIFREGLERMNQLIYDLEHCDNIRELSRYLDVGAIARDFDMETVKTLNTRINASARSSILKLDEIIDTIQGD